MDFIREGQKKGEMRSDISEEAFKLYLKFVLPIPMERETHYRFHRDPKLLSDMISLMLYGISGKRG